MGLYGGLRATDIKARKGLKKSQNILDHMGSTELAANLFRATQTDEKLRRDNVQGKAAANQVYYQVGAKVRQTIKDLGGTMPEDLSTPEKSIQQLEREQEKKKLRSRAYMTCLLCKGEMKPSTTIHTVQLKNCVVVIKNVPCLKCEQCGEVVLSADTVEKIEHILQTVEKAVAEITVVNFPDCAA